jgi:hypothetical protein
VWHNYEQQKPMIDSTFAKYDVSGTNKLEFAELKRLLRDLNDGKVRSISKQEWLATERPVSGEDRVMPAACTCAQLDAMRPAGA